MNILGDVENLTNPWPVVQDNFEKIDAALFKAENNFRFKNGQMQFWDAEAYAADNTKPWRALGVSGGQTVWSEPIED